MPNRRARSFAGAFPFRTHHDDALIRVGQHLFPINESLTLDSPGNLDSNRFDSEATGCFRTMCKRAFGGGLKHGARACGERVCPIRLDQGIGAIDRKTCLSPAAHRRAGASSRRADSHHCLPDHHLPRRLRAGDRPEPAKARRHEARPLRAHRPAGRTPRPPWFRPAGPRRQYRAAAEPAARPYSGLGRGQRPPCHHHRRRSPDSGPRPGRGQPWRQRSHPRHHQHGATAHRPRPAGRRQRHDASERQWRHGDLAADQIAAGPGHRHPGKERAAVGFGCRIVGDAVGHHRLRRADPRLRLPLAVDPRPRGRSHQRRGARPDRHRAQPRPLRIVGLGPLPRQDLLVGIDVHDARARTPATTSSPSAKSTRW